MSLLAANFETFTVYVPADAFTTGKLDLADQHTALISLVPTSEEENDVVRPPGGWCPTHVVSAFIDGDNDWLEMWSAAPDDEGRRLGGRLAPQNSNAAICIAGKSKLYLLVKGGTYPSNVFIQLARPVPCNSRS